MQEFIGTKRINAVPMSRGDYIKLRGWEVPADENPADEGYLVEYLDGGAANTGEYAGYVSWSPAEVFEKAYRPTTAMTFGDALLFLKLGRCIARKGWNGKGLYIIKVQGSNDLAKIHGYGFGEYLNEPRFTDTAFIHNTVTGELTSWVPSQSDMWAEDWQLIN